MGLAKDYLHNKIRLWDKIDDNGELKFSAFEIEKWFLDFEKVVKQNIVKSDVSGQRELLSNFNNTLARHQERLSDDVKIQWNELYEKLLNSH